MGVQRPRILVILGVVGVATTYSTGPNMMGHNSEGKFSLVALAVVLAVILQATWDTDLLWGAKNSLTIENNPQDIDTAAPNPSINDQATQNKASSVHSQVASRLPEKYAWSLESNTSNVHGVQFVEEPVSLGRYVDPESSTASPDAYARQIIGEYVDVDSGKEMIDPKTEPPQHIGAYIELENN